MKQYYFPSEEKKHEGTWLNWPHHYTYGKRYQKRIEKIWIKIAYSLHHGEKVHIIAYNNVEKSRICNLLIKNDFDMTKIDFVIAKSDDVWSRDTGPMFVFDENNDLNIVNFKFDGWGKKAPYKNDNKLPEIIANKKNIPIINVLDFVLEGGSIEVDGTKTAMLNKSSIISKNRNDNFNIQQMEKYLSQYFNVINFIWLEGVLNEDITDAHIDGSARFYNEKNIVTVSKTDFLDMYENILESDYEILLNAKNSKGEAYNIIELPMTAKNVKGLNYKGNYLNYYIGNEVLLVPIYCDKNDEIALTILSKLYEGREIIPIDITNLYPYGGMIHCVTQQQPFQKKVTSVGRIYNN